MNAADAAFALRCFAEARQTFLATEDFENVMRANPIEDAAVDSLRAVNELAANRYDARRHFYVLWTAARHFSDEDCRDVRAMVKMQLKFGVISDFFWKIDRNSARASDCKFGAEAAAVRINLLARSSEQVLNQLAVDVAKSALTLVALPSTNPAVPCPEMKAFAALVRSAAANAFGKFEGLKREAAALFDTAINDLSMVLGDNHHSIAAIRACAHAVKSHPAPWP